MATARRPVVPSTGSMPLYVVAGLPQALQTRAVSYLRKLRNCQVIAVAANSNDGILYTKRMVDSLVRAVGDFALARESRSAGRAPAPSSIALLYVPAEDEERLLQAFDFSVMPFPLVNLVVRDQKGRQLRHDPAAVELVLKEATEANSQLRSDLNLVMERTKRLSEQDGLLLPPRNFHSPNGRLGDLFIAFRRRERSWGDRLVDLGHGEFTREEVPRLRDGETRRAFKDARSVIFLRAHPTAFHGSVWEKESGAAASEVHKVLQGLFRFGAPLPSGFHHDAQLPAPAVFSGFEFDCAKAGPVLVSGTHANIYANDFVRAQVKKK